MNNNFTCLPVFEIIMVRKWQFIDSTVYGSSVNFYVGIWFNELGCDMDMGHDLIISLYLILSVISSKSVHFFLNSITYMIRK